MSNERSVTVLELATMGSLRRALFDTLQELRTGKLKPQDAIAIAKVANAILDSAKVQIEFEKLKTMYPSSANKELPDMTLADTGT